MTMKPLRQLVLLTLILALAVAAREQGPRASSADHPYWTELMESMHRMHAAMSSARPSSDTDADFVALMLPHHHGAIDMARIELVAGKDPQIRRLAQEIIADQESEIQLMQLWRQREAHDGSTVERRADGRKEP
jgi:uncharacterized protein (DUF305 family)